MLVGAAAASIAAVELLEAAGYRVQLVDKKCCGRPLISKGMLDEAKAAREHLIEKVSEIETLLQRVFYFTDPTHDELVEFVRAHAGWSPGRLHALTGLCQGGGYTPVLALVSANVPTARRGRAPSAHRSQHAQRKLRGDAPAQALGGVLRQTPLLVPGFAALLAEEGGDLARFRASFSERHRGAHSRYNRAGQSDRGLAVQ